MRLRSEESELHAESLLATGITRSRWVLSHTVIALLGTTMLMVVLGFVTGLAHGAHIGDMGQIGRVLGGALVQLPATWVLTGLVVAGFGLAPRLAAIGWGALAAFVFLGEVGPILKLNQYVMDVSPYTHVPRLPGSPVTYTPLVALTVVAAGLIAFGLFGFRRRDV